MLATVLLLLLCPAFRSPAPAPPIEGQVLVKLRAGATAGALPLLPGEQAAAALPVPRGRDEAGLARILRVRCEAGAEAALLERLSASTAVEWAEPSTAGPALHAPAPAAPLAPVAPFAPLPNDPFLSFQWHVQQGNDIDLDLPEAWALRGTFQADPILVAVIDSGFPVGTTLPDLSGMSWSNPGEVQNGVDDDGNGFVDDLHGYDFVVGEANPDGGHPHGMWVSSILAARVNNGSGLAGVAPGVILMHLRAFDDTGDFPSSGPYAGKLSAAAAILYAVDEGARLINNSWGDETGPSQVILDAVQYAADNGALMVMSTGNSGVEFAWPSQIEAAFAVAGLSPSGAKWTGSNFGSFVDISAGAESVPILDELGVFLADGTSAASPMVTGTVALLLSEDPTLPMKDQRRVLQLGATSVDALNPAYAGKLGAGLVNTERALRLLLPSDDLGFALPGSTSPLLHVYGGVLKTQVFAVTISGGPPGALAALVVGTAPVFAPGFGGTVVPQFNQLLFVSLDAGGRWHLEFPLPAALPPGVPVAWLQGLVQDAGAPFGVALTNAVLIKNP